MRLATILAGLLIMSAAPATADPGPLTPAERDRLIAKCIASYGIEHERRCVEIIVPHAAGRRAWRRYQRDGFTTERDCWTDPDITNRRACARGAAPIYREGEP